MSRGRRAVIGAALGAALAVALAGPALADDVIDQQQVARGFHSAWLWDTQTMAQPFTAGMSGELTSVSVDVNRYNTEQSNLRVGVYATNAGVPMGSALADVSLTAKQIAALPYNRAAGSLQVAFDSPVPVIKGTTYAIVVASTDPEAAFHWLDSATGIKSLSGNVSQTGIYSAQDSWSTYNPLAFATYMRPSGDGSAEGGGDVDAGSGSAQATEQKVALVLQPQDGNHALAVDVELGSWIQVPAADPQARAESSPVLLGWSTSATFPVERARAQVAAGYGVIDEVIDGLRSIFIPAGGFTQVSGGNTLYAVWG